jgi:hypothetical protein
MPVPSPVIAVCDFNHGNGLQTGVVTQRETLRAMSRSGSLILFARERAVAAFTCKTGDDEDKRYKTYMKDGR